MTAPLNVAPPLMSRQRPEFGLISVLFSGELSTRGDQTWPGPPKQSHSWMAITLIVAPPGMSRHLPVTGPDTVAGLPDTPGTVRNGVARTTRRPVQEVVATAVFT